MANFYVSLEPSPSLLTPEQMQWALWCASALERDTPVPSRPKDWTQWPLVEQMEAVRIVLCMTGLEVGREFEGRETDDADRSSGFCAGSGAPIDQDDQSLQDVHSHDSRSQDFSDDAGVAWNDWEPTVQQALLHEWSSTTHAEVAQELASQQALRRRLWALCDALMHEHMQRRGQSPQGRSRVHSASGNSEELGASRIDSAPVEAQGQAARQSKGGQGRGRWVLSKEAFKAVDIEMWLGDAHGHCGHWLLDRGWTLSLWDEHTQRHPTRTRGPDWPADGVWPRQGVFSCLPSPVFWTSATKGPQEWMKTLYASQVMERLWGDGEPKALIEHCKRFGWGPFWRYLSQYTPPSSTPTPQKILFLSVLNRWLEKGAQAPMWCETVRKAPLNAWWVLGSKLASALSRESTLESVGWSVRIGTQLQKIGFSALPSPADLNARTQAMAQGELYGVGGGVGAQAPWIHPALDAEPRVWEQWMGLLYTAIGHDLFESRDAQGESLLGILNERAKKSLPGSVGQMQWIQKMQWCLRQGAPLESIAQKVDLSTLVVAGELQALLEAQNEDRDLSWSALEPQERRAALDWVRQQRRAQRAVWDQRESKTSETVQADVQKGEDGSIACVEGGANQRRKANKPPRRL